jgi:hypothetical protein
MGDDFMKPTFSDRLEIDFEFPKISSVGDLLSQAAKLYLKNFHWVLFLATFFIPFLLIKNAWYLSTPPESKLIKLWIDSSVFGLVTIFTAPTLVYILVRSLRDRKAPSFRESLKWGLNCFPRNFGYHFITGFMILGGLILLVVPGLFVMIWYSFLSTVVSVEGREQLDPMKRSKTLAQKHMWTIFIGGLLTFLLNLFLCMAAGVIIGIVEAIAKIILHDTTPFVSTDHWLINTLVEFVSAVLNMDLGVLAVRGYLSWSREEVKISPEIKAISVPFQAPALGLKKSFESARKTPSKKRHAAAKKNGSEKPRRIKRK